MKNVKKENPLSPSAPRRLLREAAFFLLDILYNAVIIILLVVLIRSFLISPFRVIGSSMADTLASNEFILIDKLSYRLGEPEQGDAIVFRPPITNKYGPKFEERVTTDETGTGLLSLEDLKTAKTVIYCQNEWVAKRWFCQDKTREGDMVFLLPVENPSDSPGEIAWKNAEKKTVTADEIQTQALAIQGVPRQSYRIRIYDSGGPEYFVKRIIGVPGDTIKIENGRVYLKPLESNSFHVIQEPYLNPENQNHTYFNQDLGKNSFTVPEGAYFVLGDNRNHSNDSRSWFAPVTEEHAPFVPLQNISGKVLVVLWPLQDFRLIPGAPLP